MRCCAACRPWGRATSPRAPSPWVTRFPLGMFPRFSWAWGMRTSGRPRHLAPSTCTVTPWTSFPHRPRVPCASSSLATRSTVCAAWFPRPDRPSASFVRSRSRPVARWRSLTRRSHGPSARSSAVHERAPSLPPTSSSLVSGLPRPRSNAISWSSTARRPRPSTTSPGMRLWFSPNRAPSSMTASERWTRSPLRRGLLA